MTDYYVDAASGSDSNSGTSESSAWATFEPFDPYDGRVSLSAGDTVYVRDTAEVRVSELDLRDYEGTSSNRITVRNYPGESPVVDFSQGTNAGVRVEGSARITLLGLELKNAAVHGIRCRRAFNTRIESCVIHHHGSGGSHGAGIEIRGNTTPSDRTEVINTEIYGGQTEENSDGITCGDSVTNTLIEGCFIHHNADDGLGLRGADFPHSPDQPAVVRDTVFWRNGYLLDGTVSADGDGYGVKNGHPDEPNGGHRFERCIFYQNKRQGLGEVVSGATVPLTVYNCTSVDNGQHDFKFNESGVNHEVANCIGQGASGDNLWISSASDVRACNWDEDLSGEFSATDGSGVSVSFVSKDPASSDFMRPVDGSPAIDGGVDVGLPFEGSAPDWGAFEVGATAGPDGYTHHVLVNGAFVQPSGRRYVIGGSFVSPSGVYVLDGGTFEKLNP